jgi:hypothetical protein
VGVVICALLRLSKDGALNFVYNFGLGDASHPLQIIALKVNSSW